MSEFSDSKNLSFRVASQGDLNVLQELFVDTITAVCQKDYSPEQIKAWTASVQNTKRWTDLINDQYVLLAIDEKTIAGFASLKDDSYLDFFYVHKNYQSKGVAKQLYQKIEATAKTKGVKEISSDISITAKPFFESRGFVALKKQKNQVHDAFLINYKMVKSLLGA